ncbi:MAG: hypothetical protein ACRCZ9_05960 [Fusobacteriaceae bacterium]
MGYKKSFSEVDSKHWGEYKVRLSKAQGVEEVKKIFSMVTAELVKEVEENLNPVYGEFSGDFEIDMKSEKKYKVAQKIAENPLFVDLIENSDLPAILTKYADMAVNKKTHLLAKEGTENGKKIIH